MTFAPIQQLQKAVGSSVNTLATGSGDGLSATTVNSLIVIGVRVNGSSASNITITDNASTPNTYTATTTQISVGGSLQRFRQFYGVQKNSASTITANWSGSNTARVDIWEFSGASTIQAQVLDTVGSASTTATSVTTASISLTPSASGKLIVAHWAFGATVSSLSPGTGYTLETATSAAQAGEYNLSGTTSESVSMSWTTGTTYGVIASAFNAPLSPAPYDNTLSLLGVA